MEKTQKITLLAILLFISVACTETVNHVDIDTAATPTTSTNDKLLGTPTAIEEEKEEIKTSVSNSKKYIYLTIDDAPLNGSEYIDSIIRKTQVKTNIFMVGNSIDGSHRFHRYFNQMKDNPYIAIYNHSYSHANNRYGQYYKSPENVLNDFETNQRNFNITNKIARLPGRNLWQIGERRKNHKQTGGTSAELLAQHGYQIFGWDIEWHYNCKDHTPKKSIEELVVEIEEMYNKSLEFTTNHIVLLMHDQMFAKISGHNDLEMLIGQLLKLNYTFEYLSEYPGSTHNYPPPAPSKGG